MTLGFAQLYYNPHLTVQSPTMLDPSMTDHEDHVAPDPLVGGGWGGEALP